MSYTELTVWTRGIIMDKEGRDIVNSVAAAGRLEGKFAQAMENYVDNPDRTNAIEPDIAAPLIAAVVQTTGIVKMETSEPMIANKAAFRAALNQLQILPVNPVAA